MPKDNNSSYSTDSAVEKLILDAKIQDADAYALAYCRQSYVETLAPYIGDAEGVAFSVGYDTPMEMSELRKLDSQLVTLWQSASKAAEFTGKIGGDKLSFDPELKELVGKRFKSGEVLDPEERRALVTEAKNVLDNFSSHKETDEKLPATNDEMLSIVLSYPDHIKRSDIYDAVVFGVDMKLLGAANGLERVKTAKGNFEAKVTKAKEKEMDNFSRDVRLQGYVHNEEEMKKLLSSVCVAIEKSEDGQKEPNDKMLLAYAYSKYVSEGAKHNPEKITHEQIFNPYFVEEASKFISTIKRVDVEFKPEKTKIAEDDAASKVKNVSLYTFRNRVRNHRDEILDSGFRGLVNREDDENKRAIPDNNVKLELIKRAQNSCRN